LNILLQHDGDIQVEYHITDKRGSPFEMFIVLAEGQEAAAIEAASLFVADLLAERLVLADAKSLFRGRRRFLKPGSLTESDRRSYSWITSWLGTFDWAISDCRVTGHLTSQDSTSTIAELEFTRCKYAKMKRGAGREAAKRE
jgi:hypothetical protein